MLEEAAAAFEDSFGSVGSFVFTCFSCFLGMGLVIGGW